MKNPKATIKMTYERYLSLLQEKLQLNYKRMETVAEVSDINNSLRLRKNKKNYDNIPFPREEEEEMREVLGWLHEETRLLDARLAHANTLLQALEVISHPVIFMAIAAEELPPELYNKIHDRAMLEYEKWMFAKTYLKFRPNQDDFMGFQEKVDLKDDV